jgi:hypothetical protein
LAKNIVVCTTKSPGLKWSILIDDAPHRFPLRFVRVNALGFYVDSNHFEFRTDGFCICSDLKTGN